MAKKLLSIRTEIRLRKEYEQEVRNALLTQAKQKEKTIGYKNFCTKYGITYNISKLSDALTLVSNETLEMNKTLLSVIVIRIDRDLPGKGFFEVFKPDSFKGSDRDYFRQELTKVNSKKW